MSLPVFIGVIHIVVIGVVQLYLGIKIERTVGFIRIALIYIIAGTGGNLVINTKWKLKVFGFHYFFSLFS